MKFDRKSFLENLDLFMAEKEIKPRELEEATGVSKGYVSRLKKADNQSIPGIDFLLAASSMFGISVEALSTVNFAACSDNEKYYINFLDSLTAKTIKKEIIWKNFSFQDFKNKIDCKSDEELIIEQEPSALESLSQSLAGKKKYHSTFDYGKYRYTQTEGDFFSIEIDSHHRLYMVKVQLTLKDDVFPGVEMFLTADCCKKSNICCISPQNPQKYDALLYRLYDTVRDSINVNLMDRETKSVIDSFMNY